MSYLARRFGFYLVTAWAAITMNFFIPRLMPGNPAQILVSRLSAQGPITPGLYHSLSVAFGLNTNSSLLTQYFQYWGQLFHGDLGISITYYPATVASVIATALPWTIGLIGMSTIIAFIMAGRRAAHDRVPAGAAVLLARAGGDRDLRREARLVPDLWRLRDGHGDVVQRDLLRQRELSRRAAGRHDRGGVHV
jgi:ABC-type microcin C transport system permease subunit YejB